MAFKTQKDALAELGTSSTEKEFCNKSFITSRLGTVYNKKSTFTEGTNGKYPNDTNYVDFNDVERVRQPLNLKIWGFPAPLGASRYDNFENFNPLSNGYTSVSVGVPNGSKYDWLSVCAVSTDDSGTVNGITLDVDLGISGMAGDCLLYYTQQSDEPEYGAQLLYSPFDNFGWGGSIPVFYANVGDVIKVKIYNNKGGHIGSAQTSAELNIEKETSQGSGSTDVYTADVRIVKYLSNASGSITVYITG